MKSKYKTLVVSLFGGPGTGKSTIAASLFSQLKWNNIDCELVTEFAKDLVWEKRHKTFENQIYLFGKQHHRIFRLLGQVDVIITDSPLLLTPIYDIEKRESLKTLVLEEMKKCNTFNVFLTRKKQYNPNGRNQTKEQAVKIDKKIKTFLNKNKIKFREVEGTSVGVKEIMSFILMEIDGRK